MRYKSDHVALKVSSLEKSTEYYHDALGFEIEYRRDFGNGVLSTYIRIPGTEMKIQLLNTKGNLDNSGYGHIGIETDDIEGSWKQHSDAGLQPGKMYQLSFQKCYFLKDPDGYEIEILELTNSSKREEAE